MNVGNGLEYTIDVTGIEYASVLLQQREMNRFSVFSQAQERLVTSHPLFDKTSVYLHDQGAVFPIESAQRALYFSWWKPHLAQMIVNNDVHISLPWYNYFDTEIDFSLSKLRALPVVEALQDILRVVLTSSQYFSEQEFKDRLRKSKKGMSEKDITNVYDCYFAWFSFDHLLLHDFAHMLELENQASNDLLLQPYHVYQFSKIVSAAVQSWLSQEQAIRIANSCRYYRIAFEKSLKNELLVSHFQHTLTSADTIADHVASVREMSSTMDMLYTAKSWYAFFDMTWQVQTMVTNTISSDHSEIQRCADMITQSCKETTNKIFMLTSNCSIPKNLHRYQWWWALEAYCKYITSAFWISMENYNFKKHKNYYYYLHHCINHILSKEISRDCKKEYEYLYERNHNTHLLLIFEDTEAWLQQLFWLQWFLESLFAKLSVYQRL